MRHDASPCQKKTLTLLLIAFGMHSFALGSHLRFIALPKDVVPPKSQSSLRALQNQAVQPIRVSLEIDSLAGVTFGKTPMIVTLDENGKVLAPTLRLVRTVYMTFPAGFREKFRNFTEDNRGLRMLLALDDRILEVSSPLLKMDTGSLLISFDSNIADPERAAIYKTMGAMVNPNGSK